MGRQRAVSDADWNQLITLASGYLALESGDIQAAMQRALAAHMDLISALKAEQISTDIDEGRVTMYVPEGGGVALRLTRDAADVPDGPFEDEATNVEYTDGGPDEPTITNDAINSTFALDEEED